MSDYRQPIFYRFNRDSLLLVKEVLHDLPRANNILDLGAGSGVIGIELANKLNISNVHFLEMQKEWKPTLESNIAEFLSGKETKIYWESMGEWRPTMRYDLIVSNPPYYLPGKGQLSPDPVRAKCRSFLIDDWGILAEKVMMALAPGGVAWIVTLGDNLPHIKKAWNRIPFESIEREELIFLKISSPE